MHWQKTFFGFCILIAMITSPCFAKAQNTEILISGIRSNSGYLILGFFPDKESFVKEEPAFRKKIDKTKMVNGKLLLKMKLDEGTYGLSVLDDENNDDIMNFNLGIPVEGFGFSNYYLKGLSRPDFDSFKFNIQEGNIKKIIVNMRYIL